MSALQRVYETSGMYIYRKRFYIRCTKLYALVDKQRKKAFFLLSLQSELLLEKKKKKRGLVSSMVFSKITENIGKTTT